MTDRLGDEDSKDQTPRAAANAGEVGLTPEQQDAVAVLATHNAYAKQSKWTTFRSLPPKDRWPFFVQHFLLATVAVVAVLGLIIALVCTYLLRAPDPVFSVQTINMSESSKQFGELKHGFDQAANIDDDRLSDFGTDLHLGSDSYGDDTAKILPMVTAGDINIFIAKPADFVTLNNRALVSSVTDAVGSTRADALADAWVDAKGRHVSDVDQAVGLDLSESSTWTDLGLPDDAILGFSNLEHSRPYAKQFINYLSFR